MKSGWPAVELPVEGLKSPEQAKAAARLAKTYQDLRARQIARELDPLSQDDRVTEAQRLASDFYRKHPKPRVKATRSALRQRKQPARTAAMTLSGNMPYDFVWHWPYASSPERSSRARASAMSPFDPAKGLVTSNAPDRDVYCTLHKENAGNPTSPDRKHLSGAASRL